MVGLPDAGVTFNALEIALRRYHVRGDSTGTPARMPKAINFTAKHGEFRLITSLHFQMLTISGILPETEVYHSLNDVPTMIQKMKDGKATRKMVVSLA